MVFFSTLNCSNCRTISPKIRVAGESLINEMAQMTNCSMSHFTTFATCFLKQALL